MSEERSVLVIGYRSEMVEACERIGVKCVNIIDAWDKPEELPPCREGEARIINLDNTKNELMLFALARKGNLKFNGVCSSFESFVVNAAILSQTLTKPFMDPKVAVAFRDKYYQKQLLRGMVPIADFWLIEDVNRYHVSKDYIYPVVFKPVAGGGSADTHVVKSQVELEKLIKSHQNEPHLPKTMLIEQFIVGEEWHIDGWITDGELQFFSASKYGKPCIETRNGWIVNSVTLRPEENSEIYNRLHPFVEKTLNTLNLENGVFHMELFYNSTRDEFIFNECGARIGGGFIPETIQDMFKIDLHEILIRLSLGEKVKKYNEETKYYAGWTFLPSVPQGTDHLPNISKLMQLPGVRRVKYDWSPGEDIPDTTKDTMTRTGRVLIIGDSESQVRNRIKNVVDTFIFLTS